jgi:transcriptional regulator with XRE-family HTH domain
MREESGYTLKTAGHRLERSASSLSIIEKGMQSLRLRDLRHILDTYGAPPDLHQALMTLAEQEQQPGWWNDFRDIASHSDLDYASLENSATAISSIATGLVPGLLQEEEYARTVIRAGLPADQVAQTNHFLAYRVARQQILERSNPPLLHVVIDEAALRRVRGGRTVMRAQLDKLIRQSIHEHVTLQVMPLESTRMWASSRPS